MNKLKVRREGLVRCFSCKITFKDTMWKDCINCGKALVGWDDEEYEAMIARSYQRLIKKYRNEMRNQTS